MEFRKYTICISEAVKGTVYFGSYFEGLGPPQHDGMMTTGHIAVTCKKQSGVHCSII